LGTLDVLAALSVRRCRWDVTAVSSAKRQGAGLALPGGLGAGSPQGVVFDVVASVCAAPGVRERSQRFFHGRELASAGGAARRCRRNGGTAELAGVCALLIRERSFRPIALVVVGGGGAYGLSPLGATA
jgi:hypothetical protein